MARYNTFKYGDGTLYGTATTTDNLLWTFIVDWDKDGYFSGVNEAIYMVDFRLERGREYMLNPGGRGFEKMKVGKVIATFDNSDGRYNPYNTSSPLYPNISPGGLCEIAVKDGNTGTNYGVMKGVIDDIQPIQLNGQPHARIIVQDGMRWLSNKLTGATNLEGQTLQTIVEWLINDAASPWTVSADGSTLQTTETKAYWYTWRNPIYNDLQELADSEAGVVFHGRDGIIYFYNRDFTHNRTKAVTQSEILTDIVIPQPWEIIRNSIDCEYTIKQFGNLDFPGVTTNTLYDAIIGSTSAYFVVGDGETVTIDATFKYQSYRIAGYNVRSDGFQVMDSGLIDDITADCTLTWDEPEGGGTRISITNNAGESGIVVALELAGDVIYDPYSNSRTAEDASSIATYGTRNLKVGDFWTEIPDTALAIATWLLAELKDPTIHPVIVFEGRPDYQFYFDLWDRVELSIAQMGISGNFRVGKIEHEWLSPTGQLVRTTMKLEPYLTVFS